jgi:hypothetical protein
MGLDERVFSQPGMNSSSLSDLDAFWAGACKFKYLVAWPG